MNSEHIKNVMRAWQEVVEKKTMDPVDKKALKKDFDARADKDIDNDGDVDKSDEYLHNRRKTIKKAMKNESEDEMKPCPKCDGSMQNHDPECPMAGNTEKESADINTKSVDKALTHDCAKHVASEQWGFGECIAGQHTLVEQEDGTAIVTHYDVVFEHGVEFDVPVEELNILVSESHKHTSKKMKEGKNYAERTKGATKPETMKDKLKGKGAQDMAKDADMDNPELAADDAQGHEDATKAGRAVNNQAPTRGGEKRIGDKNIVNPVKGAVTKTTGKEG